jgi:hypothetical protein
LIPHSHIHTLLARALVRLPTSSFTASNLTSPLSILGIYFSVYELLFLLELGSFTSLFRFVLQPYVRASSHFISSLIYLPHPSLLSLPFLLQNTTLLLGCRLRLPLHTRPLPTSVLFFFTPLYLLLLPSTTFTFFSLLHLPSPSPFHLNPPVYLTHTSNSTKYRK